ncbi:hypothetical protein [Bacillus manliponensis]|nr:hypothetical protein [Bacillus manliponensis]
MNMVNDLRNINHISIMKVDWTTENILLTTQTSNDNTTTYAENKTPLGVSFIWYLYILSMFRFFLTILLGLAISLLIGKLFLQLSKTRQKHITTLLCWLPDSLTTVIIQCVIILMCISLATHVKLPFFSSFIIVISTCTVLIIQAMKQWLPFLYKKEKEHINNFLFLLSTLYTYSLANRNFLFAYITISFFYMECIFHVDGLLQFIVQYSVASPTFLAIGLLFLYLSYMFFTVLQTIITTSTHYKSLQSETESTNS